MHGLSSHILARENLLMTTCQPALPSEDPRLPACLQVSTCRSLHQKFPLLSISRQNNPP